MSGMDLQINSTGNASFGRQFQMAFKENYVKQLLLITGSLTIILNTLLLLCCILKPRTLMKEGMHVVALCSSDALSGLATVLVSTYNQRPSSYEACGFVQVLFSASQCASMFLLAFLCLHRYFKLKNILRITDNRFNQSIFIVIGLIVWVVSLVICSLPLLVFGNKQAYPRRCSIAGLLGGMKQTAILFYSAIYSVPLLFMNVIYTLAMVTFRKVMKSVADIPSEKRMGPRDTKDLSREKQSKQLSNQRNAGEPKPSTSKELDTSTQNKGRSASNNKEHTRRIDVATRDGNVRFFNWNKNSKHLHSDDNNDVKRSAWQTVKNACVLKSITKQGPVSSGSLVNVSSTATKGQEHRGIISRKERLQKRTIITLGILLVVVDVVTVPRFVLIFLKHSRTPSTVKQILAFSMSLNSLFNPLIYAWRWHAFRKAVKETLTTCSS